MHKLPLNEAHLWYVLSDNRTLESRHDMFLDMCDEDEKKRFERYHFDKDKWLYLLTRGLIRTTLSKYLGGPPKRWRFQQNEYGKPYLAMPQEPVGSICFNLTNTRGLVAVLIARNVEVGIDAEYSSREVDVLGLSTRFFSPIEQKELKQHPVSNQQRRFLDYWTLKESFIKAKGMGLSIPLDKFSIILNKKEIGIQFHGMNESPSHWQLDQLELESGHLVASTINHKEKPKLTIIHREAFSNLGTAT